MPAKPVKQVDVAILGAGVAGLWTARLLRARGWNVVLIEPDSIAAGQTIAAQGIIHGGTKYTLTRRLTGASEAISQMPAQWAQARNGRGDVPLCATKQLADHCIIWSTAPIASRFKTFFAARTMKARVAPIAARDQPRIIQRPPARVTCYRIAEFVLDIPSLLADLAGPIEDRIIHARCRINDRPGAPTRSADGYQLQLSWDSSGHLAIQAAAVIAAAGAGNEELLHSLAFPDPGAAQRRALHMVLIKGPLPEPIFGHCIGAPNCPRLTVTAHEWNGPPTERIWYLGGELAETGVHRSREEQIDATQRELAEIFPSLDLARLQCDTFRIDRAEPRQPDGARPDEPFIVQHGRALMVWPTKLAFAPLLAQRVSDALARAGISPSTPTSEPILNSSLLRIALPPWKTNRQWSPLDPSAVPA